MNPVSKKTVMSLANTMGVTIGVMQEVATNQLSKTLQGHAITREVLTELVASRFQARLSVYLSKPAVTK